MNGSDVNLNEFALPIQDGRLDSEPGEMRPEGISKWNAFLKRSRAEGRIRWLLALTHVQLKECAQRGDRSYGNNIRGKMLTVRTMSCRKQSYGQADNVVTLQMMCGKRKITSSSVDQSRRRKMCAPTVDFDSICAAWGSWCSTWGWQSDDRITRVISARCLVRHQVTIWVRTKEQKATVPFAKKWSNSGSNGGFQGYPYRRMLKLSAMSKSPVHGHDGHVRGRLTKRRQLASPTRVCSSRLCPTLDLWATSLLGACGCD